MPAGQAGGKVLDDGEQRGAVAGEQPPGLAHGHRETADLSLPDGVLAAGISGKLAPG